MSYEAEEAEIEASRAPLMDHLIELRKRLIICVAAVGLAFVLCFALSTQIYILLLHPFSIAGQLLAAREQAHGHATAGLLGPLVDAKNLLLTLVGAHKLPPVEGAKHISLVFTAPLEFFFTKLHLALFGAIVVAFPVLAWQVYGFVAPGLYKRERKAFLPFLVAAPLLFAMGAALVYFAILPFVLWFSLSQQIVGAGDISVQMLPKVSDYLDLVTKLLLAFGLCFQLPIVLSLLAIAGLVNAKMLISGWRYAVVGVVAVAAIITPPDPISMMMLALPIVLLYFVSIACVKVIEVRRAKDDAAAEAAAA